MTKQDFENWRYHWLTSTADDSIYEYHDEDEEDNNEEKEFI